MLPLASNLIVLSQIQLRYGHKERHCPVRKQGEDMVNDEEKIYKDSVLHEP